MYLLSLPPKGSLSPHHQRRFGARRRRPSSDHVYCNIPVLHVCLSIKIYDFMNMQLNLPVDLDRADFLRNAPYFTFVGRIVQIFIHVFACFCRRPPVISNFKALARRLGDPTASAVSLATALNAPRRHSCISFSMGKLLQPCVVRTMHLFLGVVMVRRRVGPLFPRRGRSGVVQCF